MIWWSTFNWTIFRDWVFDKVLVNDFSDVLVPLASCWKRLSSFKLFTAVTIVSQLQILNLDY